MGSWNEQIAVGKLPTCPEVCEDCRDGKHVFHMLNELSDLYAFWVSRTKNGRTFQILSLTGYSEDELWLEEFLRMIGHVYSRE